MQTADDRPAPHQQHVRLQCASLVGVRPVRRDVLEGLWPGHRARKARTTFLEPVFDRDFVKLAMQVRRALDNRSLDEFVERMNYGVFGDLFLLAALISSTFPSERDSGVRPPPHVSSPMAFRHDRRRDTPLKLCLPIAGDPVDFGCR